MESAASLTLLREAHHIDQDVTLAINALHSPITDGIWRFFSLRKIWFVLYAAVLVFLFIRLGWKRTFVVLAVSILTVVACDQFANVTKAYFERLRPCWDLNMIDRGLRVLEEQESLYGFFSAHAANAMGFAVCTYTGFRNDHTHSYRIYGICIFLWAVLVGMSRVFVGKHFLGDVLVGLAVGLLFGWAFSRLGRLLIDRLRLSGH